MTLQQFNWGRISVGVLFFLPVMRFRKEIFYAFTLAIPFLGPFLALGVLGWYSVFVGSKAFSSLLEPRALHSFIASMISVAVLVLRVKVFPSYQEYSFPNLLIFISGATMAWFAYVGATPPRQLN